MDSTPSDTDTSESARRKGKTRAAPEEITESTPLLDPSQSRIPDATPSVTGSQHRRRRLLVLLSTVFLTTLGLCLIAVIVLIALTYSYNSKITNAVRDEVLDRAVVIKGPDRVDVINATEGSLWVQVDMDIGVDAGTAIDVVLDADNEGRVDYGATAIRRTLGRWFVRRVHRMTASADVASLYSKDKFIANITMPPITLPLTLDRTEDNSWLTHLSFPVHVNLTEDGRDVSAVAREAWKHGILLVDTVLHHVQVGGGGKQESGWRQRLKFHQDRVTMQSRIDVPKLPGLPRPGTGSPFPELSHLVTLKSFNISTVNHGVSIKAVATIRNPLPFSLHVQVPSIPFFVALSSTNQSDETVTVTVGHAKPFSLTHPNITVHLDGTIPPLPRSSSSHISAFVSAYLAGIDAPILVGSSFLPGLEIPAVFPAPHPKPKILQDVHIRNMHINLRGESVLASGTINAHVVLPIGVDVDVDAQKIWPDVLVFDGEVPSDDDEESETTRVFGPSRTTSKDEDRAEIPKDPLPSPLPPRAFARIRPNDWLPSQSKRLPDSSNGTVYEVTAEVVDVPLEVLPGRDHLLRSFVSKVLFSGPGGALAGVKGTAAVAAAIDGLPVEDEDGNDHVFELVGLPFSGSVRVGRKGL